MKKDNTLTLSPIYFKFKGFVDFAKREKKYVHVTTAARHEQTRNVMSFNQTPS